VEAVDLMPKQVSKKAQAKFARRALLKLKSTGLYSGKLDLRRKPSKYQARLIEKYRDVVTGRAQVIKPKNPKTFKSLFRVVGDKVIVPRRKGEKIKVTQRGAIVGERKVGKRVVRSRYRRMKANETIKAPTERTQYAVPFIRGRDKFGKPILQWKRFPSKEFLADYMTNSASVRDYSDYANYVVEETLSKPKSDKQLESIIEKRGLAKPHFKKKRGHNKTGRSK
jgi:hypothetical protein